MKKILCLLLLVFGFTNDSFAQIGWWTTSDTLNVFNKNKGSILIGSYQPLGKLTVGPDDKFYNLALVGDYNNLAKNYLQIGVTGRGFENLQGQTIFDLYHSNLQPNYAGYNFRINGNSQFFINGEGNIGVGTEKPEAKLDLSGGPNWGGFTKALRIPAEHVIKFESNGNEYGMVATGGSLNFVMSNQNESTNPFGVPFSRIVSLQRNKVVIEGDIEVKGKIYSQGQIGGGGNDLPIDNGGGGGPVDNGGGGGILPSIAQQGSGAQDWEYVVGNPNIFYMYQNGNVGIGTTSPTKKLEVYDGANNVETAVFKINGATGTVGVGKYIDFVGMGSVGWVNNATSTAGMWIGASPSAKTVYVGTLGTYNGNVGIGTTSPLSKLTIQKGTLGTYDQSYFSTIPSLTLSGNAITSRTDYTVQQILYLHQPNTYTGSKGSGFGIALSYWEDAGSNYPRTRVDFQTTGRTTDDIKAGNTIMSLRDDGNVGIGTTNPGTDKLAVNGTIRAKELYLTTAAGAWSDFVFEQGYNLRSLKQVENFIRKNGHLPEIPSQKEVSEKGVGVIDMQTKLLQKIEELTLYVIEQNKKNEEQNKRIQVLEERLKGKK